MKATILFLLSTLLFSVTDPEYVYITDYDLGLAAAEETDQPIFLLFTGEMCKNNTDLKSLISNSDKVSKLLAENYISVVLHVDDNTRLQKEQIVERDGQKITLRTKGNLWADVAVHKYGCTIQPMMVIIDVDQNILKKAIQGSITENELLEYLKE